MEEETNKIEVVPVENQTAVEQRFQFYKNTTQVDPITKVSVTLNVPDEWPITLKEIEDRKADIIRTANAQVAELDAKIAKIKAL